MSDIAERVKKVVTKALVLEPTDAESLTDDTPIVPGSFGADSLDMQELILQLEDEFGIKEIPDAEAQSLDTVGKIIAYVTTYSESLPSQADAVPTVAVATPEPLAKDGQLPTSPS